MHAIAVDARSANGNCYHSLRAEFEDSYQNMMDLSREFTAILMVIPAGLSQAEQQARKDAASQAYEDSRVRFMAAVANLNDFRISQIISSRSAIPLAVVQH